MTIDLLWPWRAAALAILVALGWAGALRLLRRPDLAALGAGVGMAVGTVLAVGAVPLGPRDVAERLPLLACAGAALGLLLALPRAGRGPLVACGVALGLAAAAWWLAGAPLALPDSRRQALSLLAPLVLAGALMVVLRGPWQAAYLAALLAVCVWLAAPPGPWVLLALVALGAALGGGFAGRDWNVPHRLAPVLGLAALVGGPVLARGGAIDWTAAVGPVLSLWAAPVLATQVPGRFGKAAAWIVAGALAVLFTWLQIRGT